MKSEMKAMLELLKKLDQGRQSGEEEGWLTAEDIRTHFQERRMEDDQSTFVGGRRDYLRALFGEPEEK